MDRCLFHAGVVRWVHHHRRIWTVLVDADGPDTWEKNDGGARVAWGSRSRGSDTLEKKVDRNDYDNDGVALAESRGLENSPFADVDDTIAGVDAVEEMEDEPASVACMDDDVELEEEGERALSF